MSQKMNIGSDGKVATLDAGGTLSITGAATTGGGGSPTNPFFF